jgi:hypothetical protein
MVFGQAPAAGSAVDKLLPYGLGFLLVLAVLLWFARGFFGEWIKKAGGRSFSRLFPGNGRVGGRRLLGYRKAVEIDYGKHALGFFRTEPIDIRTVYVPLQYESGERREDVYERIRAEPRSVVVGPAGAGKSLLLKNSMLIWAAGTLGRRPHVPVMVDLHRCNTGEHTLVDCVAACSEPGTARPASRYRDSVSDGGSAHEPDRINTRRVRLARSSRPRPGRRRQWQALRPARQ